MSDETKDECWDYFERGFTAGRLHGTGTGLLLGFITGALIGAFAIAGLLP